MKGLAVPPLPSPYLRGLALWILNKAISWRHDVSREHLLYSERELERIVRIRNFHEEKAARERERKARQRAIKADREDKKLAFRAMKAAAKGKRRT
jgi:hypothetical protein